MKRIYLDNASATPMDPEVIRAMLPYLNKYGNPRSFYHQEGLEARRLLEFAREKIAKLLGVQNSEITFTSGRRESNNLALQGISGSKLCLNIDHSTIIDNCNKKVKVNTNGIVDPEEIEKAIKGVKVISLSHSNTEIGTIQPIKQIAEIAKKHKVLFHLDVSTSFNYLDFNIDDVDLLTLSGECIYGPKMAAVLYVKEGIKLKPLFKGDEAEDFRGAVGLSKAIELAIKNRSSETKRLGLLRDKLINGLLETPDSWLNGSNNRVANNANVGFKYIEGEGITMSLDLKGIAVATGSACTSQFLKASHVLQGIGQTAEQAHGSIRFTLGKDTISEDIDYTIKAVKEVVEDLRKMSPLRK